jgi:hypothetical protein
MEKRGPAGLDAGIDQEEEGKACWESENREKSTVPVNGETEPRRMDESGPVKRSVDVPKQAYGHYFHGSRSVLKISALRVAFQPNARVLFRRANVSRFNYLTTATSNSR